MGSKAISREFNPMRIAIASSIVCSVIFLGSAAVTAAPLAL